MEVAAITAIMVAALPVVEVAVAVAVVEVVARKNSLGIVTC